MKVRDRDLGTSVWRDLPAPKKGKATAPRPAVIAHVGTGPDAGWVWISFTDRPDGQARVRPSELRRR